MSFFKTNDGIRIHYQWDGPFDGQVVLLLGGYSSNISTWLPQVEALNTAGYRTLRMDYRSHGNSDKTLQGLRIARLAMDVQELIKTVNVKKFHVVGHSMGASVAEIYVSLFGNQKVISLTTEDQPPKLLNEGTWTTGLKESSMTQLASFTDRFPRIKLTKKHLTDEIKRNLSDYYTPFDFKLTRPLLLDGLVQDWRDVLPLEDRPHLFLSGDDSPLYPSDYPEVALKLQGDAKSIGYHFMGVGHVPHLESFDEFNKILLVFLKQGHN